MIVYSTRSGAIRARSSAARIATAPRSTARSGASPPRNRPIGVRAPATRNERVMPRVYERPDRTDATSVTRSGPVRERLLDDLEDLVAHELVVLDERVAERGVDVTVLRQDIEEKFTMSLEAVLEGLLGVGVH